MSVVARPLISRSTSSAVVYVQNAFLRISSFGSPESWTRSRTRRKMKSTISPSGLACPGGFTAACRHWTMPPEFEIDPFFSMKNAAGRRKTSVWMDFGSTPGRLQKSTVSVSQISWTTSVSSFPSASNVRFRFGTVTAGFWPTIHSTFIFPARASSKIENVP